MSDDPINLLAPYPAQRYRLEFDVRRPIEFREYAGSALRGMFGHALRRLACATGAKDCSGCPLHANCVYGMVFESRGPAGPAGGEAKLPHPYVVEPAGWLGASYPAGSTFWFDIVVLGPALANLSLLIGAWAQALTAGLGPRDGAARLARVLAEGVEEPVWVAGGALRAHPMALPAPPAFPSVESVTLHFETPPLRMTRNGRTLGIEELQGADVLRALLRRAGALTEIHLRRPLAVDFSGLASGASRIQADKSLQWLDWARHSTRQRRQMRLGGAIGHWRLHGCAEDLAVWWPLLHLGQWLHIGKLADFGLGRYRILDAHSDA